MCESSQRPRAAASATRTLPFRFSRSCDLRPQQLFLQTDYRLARVVIDYNTYIYIYSDTQILRTNIRIYRVSILFFESNKIIERDVVVDILLFISLRLRGTTAPRIFVEKNKDNVVVSEQYDS